jgi:hypothetical protein
MHHDMLEDRLNYNDNWYICPVGELGETKIGKVDNFSFDPIYGFNANLSATHHGRDDRKFYVRVDTFDLDDGYPPEFSIIRDDNGVQFEGEINKCTSYDRETEKVTFDLTNTTGPVHMKYKVTFDLKAGNMEWSIERVA